MSFDDWETDEVMSLYELVAATRDSKYADDDLIGEIHRLDKLRRILKKFNLEKLDTLLKKLADVISEHTTNDSVESQDNT